MKKAIEAIEKIMCDLAKRRDRDVNFTMAIMLDDREKGHHVVRTVISTRDNHHFLDLQSALMEKWWEQNHAAVHINNLKICKQDTGN